MLVIYKSPENQSINLSSTERDPISKREREQAKRERE